MTQEDLSVLQLEDSFLVKEVRKVQVILNLLSDNSQTNGFDSRTYKWHIFTVQIQFSAISVKRIQGQRLVRKTREEKIILAQYFLLL